MKSRDTLLQLDKGQLATSLHLVDKATLAGWLGGQPERIRQTVLTQNFKAEEDQCIILPGDRADEWSALIGVANVHELDVWSLAKAAQLLPEGLYRVAETGMIAGPGPAGLGWLLGQYRFDRYKQDAPKKGPVVLLTNDPSRMDETLMIAEATFLVRDLVNIPASDMGPVELQKAVEEIGTECGGRIKITTGVELDKHYPMIAAVGRGAHPERAPRLIELEWGDPAHPRLALIGKGVVFDSGGLDIKPAHAMRLMKKDMGGAAHALALARLIMKNRLPVRLYLLIPAVENAISGNAFRPGDVLKSRKGIHVEIGNTDAEGRLILADALSRAIEEEPDILLDFATLTGAARVALGPDLPALFANDDALANALLDSGYAISDPLWRMPLWKPYGKMLASEIADISNATEGSMAGAVTAALFLQKFVPDTVRWAHIDTFAWRTSTRPGRPKGGDAMGLRAAWHMLKARYAS